MTSLNNTLAVKLAAVQRPGNYFASGTVEAYLPHMEVQSVGRIALPFLAHQAEQLIAVATQAPYGRGTETLLDTSVRKTWQINADQVKLGGRHWPQTLKSIVDRVVSGLGVAEPISVELYKLLIYESGDFFVNHRDSEKTPGMFATLVIVLPSVYTGGELIIRHNGHEAAIDLCSGDASEVVAYAAFYADCVHEVRPVTSGCRLTLIYNLVRQGAGQLQQAPGYELERDGIGSLLQQWAMAQGTADAGPDKLIYPLEHAYTAAELAFDRLKGADAAVASVLMAAGEQAKCELHLVLLTIEESGSAQCVSYAPRKARGRRDAFEDQFEVEEVLERSATLTEWRTVSSHNAGIEELPFNEDEICPLGALGGMAEADVEFQEATGNEGASFDRIYCRAALVIWPCSQKLAIISRAGLVQSLYYLDGLVGGSVSTGVHGFAPKTQALQLAGLMLNSWPPRPLYYRGDSKPAMMMGLLQQLGDTALVERFLIEVAVRGNYGKSDNSAMISACRMLPLARAIELLSQVVMANQEVEFAACCGLLHASVGLTNDPTLLKKLLPTAASLCQGLPDGTDKTSVKFQTATIDSEMIIDLLRALSRMDAVIGGHLAESTSERLLASPEIYPMDGLVIPVAIQMVGEGGAELLHQACLRHLKDQIASPLHAPSDWRRDNAIACRCQDCAELSRFLDNPALATWTFKAAEMSRRHVMASITDNQVDVDCKTDTNGRPYRLVCVKNQASYQRRVSQRERDIDSLTRLEGRQS